MQTIMPIIASGLVSTSAAMMPNPFEKAFFSSTSVFILVMATVFISRKFDKLFNNKKTKLKTRIKTFAPSRMIIIYGLLPIMLMTFLSSYFVASITDAALSIIVLGGFFSLVAKQTMKHLVLPLAREQMLKEHKESQLGD